MSRLTNISTTDICINVNLLKLFTEKSHKKIVNYVTSTVNSIVVAEQFTWT